MAQFTNDFAIALMKGGQHLLTLVNDVLDLAKIESEQLSIADEGLTLGQSPSF